MIDLNSQEQLKGAIADCISADRSVLGELRSEIRPLRNATRQIQPRAAASVSLVGTDGGNNQLHFDPFMVQLVRVVDSSNNEYCLEALCPTTPIQALDKRQFKCDGTPRTALGEMMKFLQVRSLSALSHMIRPTESGEPRLSQLGAGVPGIGGVGHSLRCPQERLLYRCLNRKPRPIAQ